MASASDDFASVFGAAFARLRALVDRSCATEPDPGWTPRAAAAVRTALAFAAEHPDDAQLLTNGALARGRSGFALYDGMLDHFSGLLREGRGEREWGPRLPDVAVKAMVGGVASLIAQRVDSGQAAELPALTAEAVQFVLTPYLGNADARRASLEHA